MKPFQTFMEQVFLDVRNELIHADEKYADDPMTISEIRVALKTIEAEFVEMEREALRMNIRIDDLYKENIQLIAMGVKFMRNITMPLKIKAEKS